MSEYLKSIWFSVGMGAIGIILVSLPWTGAWKEAMGQRLLLIVLPCTYLALLVAKYHQVNRRRRGIAGACSHIFPLMTVDHQLKNVKPIRAITQTVYGICMVTDAEGYTALSESLDSSDLIGWMNRYYKLIFGPIKANGGNVVQMAGDSVLSLWSAPGPVAGLETKACNAAYAIIKEIETFNAVDPGHALPTRIGIHAGYFSLGNIGAIDHFEYRPVGDIVNTASRLEDFNKTLGTKILISRQVAENLSIPSTRCLGSFVFRGKTSPTEVYELVKPAAPLRQGKSDKHTCFRRGLEAFQRRRWNEAENFFRTIVEKFGKDGPSQFYLHQITEYSQRHLENDWDGTVIMDRK